MFALAALVSFTKLLPFAIFGLFAVGAWMLLEMVGGGKQRAEERLEELRNPSSRRRDEQNSPVKKKAMATRVLSKASTMAKPLQPKSAEEESKLKRRLSEAGFRNENTVGIFLGLKFIGL